jgi:restriction system protein
VRGDFVPQRLWGIHNDHPELGLVEEGFVSVGWEDLGNLASLEPNRDAFKAAVREAYPEYKEGAIPVAAGVLFRFVHEMKPGDLVLYPYKPDSTLAFGRVTSEYRWDAAAHLHRHRRDVEWLDSGVPRQKFSQAALYEIGSAVTLFTVKRHANEFLSYLGAVPADAVAAPQAPSDETEVAEDEPNAARIEEWTRDYIIHCLMHELTGHEFEHFVAELLQAMGYKTRVTTASGDGGIDVVAHKDPLGLEPPIIKVQCKRTLATQGGPNVQQLTGALAPGGNELGLFVTLGTFSADARHIERTRQDLRLLSGPDLVELIFTHYERMAPAWQRLLPMRRVFVIDRDPETG